MKTPSVSELLDLLNKPALVYWANNLGLKGVKLNDYYRESKKKGISLHSQIKRFVEEKVPFENIEDQRRFMAFCNGKEILDLEKDISTKFFVGRYDAKIKIGEDVYLCDFKSNEQLYYENIIQLTAYRMANPGCKVAIVEIPSFKFKPFEIEDFKEYEDVLKCLSFIYKSKAKFHV